MKTSDFDDAPGEREAIECLTVGETQLARWRPMAWTVGCLIAFDDEIACDFFRAFDKVVERKTMEPKNGGLEDEFPFQTGVFRFHVKFPGCIWKQTNSSPQKFLGK